jgi:hypothetical protein
MATPLLRALALLSVPPVAAAQAAEGERAPLFWVWIAVAVVLLAALGFILLGKRPRGARR